MSATRTNLGEPPILARLAITLGAPFVVWLVGSRPLELLEAQGVMAVAELTVGLAPVVAGFLVVEVFAAVLPQTRALRSSGPLGRARLTRWAMIASAAALGFQLLGTLLFWNRLGVLTFGSALTLIAVNVPFTLGMVWLAQRVSEQGLANGYAVLLAAQALPVDLVLEHPYGRLVGLGLVAACMAVVAVVLLGHKGTQRHGDLVLRAPLSGLLPLTLGSGLLLLPYSRWAAVGELVPLGSLERVTPGTLQHLVALTVVVLLLTVALSWAFHRPSTVLSLLPGMDAFDVQLAVRDALPYTVMALMVLTLGGGLAELSLSVPVLAHVPGLAYLTALLLDAREEWQARERLGPLVAVWDEHRAYALGPLRQALEGAQIPVHPRASHYRPLVQFMGPLVPLTLMVPEAQAEAALSVLTARNAVFQDALVGHTPSTF